MKKLKITICSLLVLCSCFVLSACDGADLKTFDASLFEIGKTEFVYDGQSHVFEVNYPGVDVEVEYSLTKTDFEDADELNFVGDDAEAVTYNVYFEVSADGYKDYVSENAVQIKVVPKAVELKEGTTYSYYNGLADAVEAVETEGSIKFYKDVTAPGVKVQAGKEIEVDLNGYTFTPNVPVGSVGTVTLGLQPLKGSDVSIKNGTIKAGQPGIKMLINNYSDLTLDNVVLDGRGLIGTGSNQTGANYVLSNNFGNVVIKGNTQIITDENDYAFDLWYGMFETYNDGVSVTFDSTFTGKISGYVEYGAANNVEGWKEKTILTINGGDFSEAIFKASSTHATIAEANINLPQGWSLVESATAGEYVISK